MGVLQFALQNQYVPVNCGADGCGLTFGMPLAMYNRRIEDHKNWYCPNGHSRYFAGESEAEKLKRQLEAKEHDLEWVRKQRDRADRKAAAARGQVTKLKNRIGNGVCPCCSRSFSNLGRHMKHMHPEFKKAEP